MTNQEIILAGDVVVYNPYRQDIVKMQKQNELVAFDYTSKKGIEEAKSYIYQLRKSRAAVEKTRKEEKASSLEYGRKVDNEAKQISELIDKMIEVHQKPIDEIEEREKLRVESIRKRIDALAAYTLSATGDSASLYDLLETVNNHIVDESYQELELTARRAKESTVKFLEDTLISVLAAEHLAEENERLRKEAAERAQKDHEERIAREAVAKATKAAELAVEKAQRETAEAIRNAETAAQRERDRIAAEAKSKEDERIAREENNEHMKQVHRAILNALLKECGVDEEVGKKLVVAIRSGFIPNAKINY
jgi:colicin import membrane protein